jgi:hypothetical protein
LLSIDFGIEVDEDMLVSYEVGQPMGAYSSWAMLALTHHVIIGSLYKNGEKPLYAVLGDDMATTPDKGDRYCAIMSNLGVSISKSKSLLDSFFIELAKKLIDKRDDTVDAILGPKLISRSVRNKFLCVGIVLEAIYRKIVGRIEVFNMLRKLDGHK